MVLTVGNSATACSHVWPRGETQIKILSAYVLGSASPKNASFDLRLTQDIESLSPKTVSVLY